MLPARATNRRACAVAVISSPNGSDSEIAASRFSVGVITAAFVRGVTTSTSSARAAALDRRLTLKNMVVVRVEESDGRRRAHRAACRLPTDRPAQCQEFVPNGLKVGPATLPPGLSGQRFGEPDDVARTPSEQASEPQHAQPEPRSLPPM